MRVRRAVEADLPRLMELFWQLSALGVNPEPAPRSISKTTIAALTALAADGRFACFVLEDAGHVTGSATVYVLPNLTHGGDAMALIENVVVDETCRGRGYGRRLMEAAEQFALEADCFKIMLASNLQRDPAHRFYEGLGYQATHKGFMKFPENRQVIGVDVSSGPAAP
jgi:GNAT superfamily N-acetyltransferase